MLFFGIFWNQSPTIEHNNGEQGFGIRSSFDTIQVGEGAAPEVSGAPDGGVAWWFFKRRQTQKGAR